MFYSRIADISRSSPSRPVFSRRFVAADREKRASARDPGSALALARHPTEHQTRVDDGGMPEHDIWTIQVRHLQDGHKLNCQRQSWAFARSLVLSRKS